MSSLLKNTFREVKQSLGRFIAIFAIIALGAGFFVGLRICRPDFLLTFDSYVSEMNFFDYRLVSTLGLTDADVEAVRELDGITDAEGSVCADFLFNGSEGESLIMTAVSMPERINLLDITAGRAPENPDECLADPLMYGEEDIGSRIFLSSNNCEDTFDYFAYESYEIVGLAESVSFININRGSSTLGDGGIDAYIYIPREGFAVDYLTDIYVTVDGGGFVYSDEYKSSVEPYESELKSFMEDRAVIRYNDIIDEANEKLEEAKQLYEEGMSEYLPAREEYEKARADFDKKKSETMQQLSDAEAQLDEAEQLLQDPSALDEKEAELKAYKKQIEDGYSEYESGMRKLKLAYGLVNEQISYYENLIAEKQADIASEQAEIAACEAELEEAGTARSALLKAQISSCERHISVYEGEISAAQSRLAEHQQSKAEKDAEYAPYIAELEAGKAQLDSSYAEVEAGIKQLADAKAQIASGSSTIKSSRAELEKNKKAAEEGFAEGEKELNSAKNQLDSAAEELQKGAEELKKAENKVKDIDNADTYVLGRSTNIGYACFESDTMIVHSVAAVFPYFFFLISALVCLTTMTRMIEDERTQIGIFKALGYSPIAIMSKYLLYSGSATLLGSVLGIALCIFLFPAIVWYAYGTMYNFSHIMFSVNWQLVIGITVANLVVMLLVTWFCGIRELKSVPAELIRPKAPEKGKRILLERFTWLWSRLSFMQKVSARNIFRYKKRIFMMLVGIGGCTALMLTALGLNNTCSCIVEKQYDELFNYDYEVTLAYEMDNEEKADFLASTADGTADSMFLYRSGADISFGGLKKSITLTATDSDKIYELVNLIYDGERAEYPGVNETIINHNIASQLGVEIGDTVQLQNSDLDTMNVEVVGFFDNYVQNYAYVCRDTCIEQWGYAPEEKTVLVQAAEGADVSTVGAEIGRTDGVRSVQMTEDSAKIIVNMMSSVIYVIAFIVVCAGMLGFIVLFNLTNINITERIREIATLKVLGFYPREAADYVFRENMVLTGFCAAAGLGLGVVFHAFVMKMIKVDMMYLEPRISLLSFIASFVLTFVFAFGVNILMRRRIDGIDMAGALKSIE